MYLPSRPRQGVQLPQTPNHVERQDPRSHSPLSLTLDRTLLYEPETSSIAQQRDRDPIATTQGLVIQLVGGPLVRVTPTTDLQLLLGQHALPTPALDIYPSSPPHADTRVGASLTLMLPAT